ncbi:MAG: HAD family phosphatase [Clostridia bacterium]|nr:HAD family phosphatase [Clostridia bacterium]
MTRLVFCDLDGTLLSSGRDRLPGVVLSEIKRITDKGIYFCIASGRPYSQLKSLLGEHYRRVVFICLDGAITMHRDCVLGKHPLARPEELLGYADATLFCRGGETEISAALAAARITEAINRAGGEVLKIALHGKKANSGFARLCYEGGGIYEYVQNGVDKGTAAKALCEKLRIDPSNTAALGDGENDIPLLRFAGKAFRMPQSHRALADLGFPVCESEKFLSMF